MAWIDHAVTSAPEIFLFLAIAIGTFFGRIRIHGFAIGATACTLIVAVILGQLGTFVIPALLKSMFFGLFVFTIGYRSGPEFFASLNFQTLAQVALALVMGGCGLIAVLHLCLHAASRSRHRRRARRRQPDADIDDGHGIGRVGAACAAGRPSCQATAGQYRSRLRGYLYLRLHPGSAVRAARRAAADGRQSQRGGHQARGRAVRRSERPR